MENWLQSVSPQRKKLFGRMTTPKGNCSAEGTSIVESGVRRLSANASNIMVDDLLIKIVLIRNRPFFRERAREMSSIYLGKPRV